MTKKKSKTWYGIKTPRESLKIMEVEIVKETATRIYLSDDAKVDLRWNTEWLNKLSGYERWFNTREAAVKTKLRFLRRAIKSADENVVQAKNCLAQFKAQEDARG